MHTYPPAQSLQQRCAWCRLGNGINWKSQVFPAMQNYDADNPVPSITNVLKRQYQVRQFRGSQFTDMTPYGPVTSVQRHLRVRRTAYE